MKIVITPIDRLVPYEKNVKKHDPVQVKKIATSIKDLGWDQPIVVDKDYVIIKGHGRRLAAISLGLTEVPVLIRADLTPDQVKAARLADNRVALGDIDTDMFREELLSMNYDLSGIFEDKELDYSLSDLGVMIDTSIITDLSAAVDQQETETLALVDTLQDKRVAIHKVLGFKDVAGRDQIWITKFMANIEGQTGKTGVDAMIAFAKGELL